VSRRLAVHCHRFALALLLLAVGCAVGPDYKPPEPAMPAGWDELSSGVTQAPPADLTRWWTMFGDPILNDLVRDAVAGNLTLREAVARVDEARARYGVAHAGLFPQLDADGSATHNLQSQNGPSFGGDEYNDLIVGVAASWEVDVFGRVRRSVEAAAASEEAAEDDQHNVAIVVAANVADSYVSVRTLQQRLAVARANLTSQEQIFNLTKVRFEMGLSSGLDVAQAEQVLASTRTLIPPLELALTEEINRLGVLLGEQPGALRDRLASSAPIPQPPDELAIGLPINLLRQRPDIRRAERELAAATAQIGVAVADLYPRFTLLGSFAFESTKVENWIEGPSRMFSVGPKAVWNVFDAGRLRSVVHAEQAVTAQALARYEQQLLVALQEVENALAAFGRTREERVAVEEAVTASSESLDLATLLYKDGVVDFQNVLDAQRTLLDFEERLAITDGNVVNSLIRLYLALGGGWDPTDLTPPSVSWSETVGLGGDAQPTPAALAPDAADAPAGTSAP
jgi:NodT family efflux transporter outer membrane factor (OMF) lipoprotein